MASTTHRDEQMLTRLYDDCAPRVFGLVRRVTGDQALAEEVLQDVFLDVWQRAGSVGFPADEGREWILGLAHDSAVAAVRARRTTDSAYGASKGPRATLSGPIAGLSDEERLVIELAYFDGFTQHEIAAVTQSSLAEVKRITRGAVSHLEDAPDVV